jgi:hypothetical protein
VLSNTNEKSLEFAMYAYTEVVISVHLTLQMLQGEGGNWQPV